jgi:acetoin utilization protein AcuB
MLLRDVMSTNVVSVPSNTTLVAARRILDAHGFRRLPVIDKGKLVGVVTRDALDKSGPSQLTTFSIHELSYLLSNITVEKVMRRGVVTATPEMTVEEAVALAQSKKVGMLIVVESGKVVGVATTNDFFYKVLNPILGITMAGCRIEIQDCYEGTDAEKVLSVVNKLGVKINSILAINFPDVPKHNLLMHLATDDCKRVIEAVGKLGYEVKERAR